MALKNNRLGWVLMVLMSSGCHYDSGSSSYAFAAGKSYQASCLEKNLKVLDGYTVSSVVSSEIAIQAEGLNSELELDRDGDNVTGYTLTTKTEKSADKDRHGKILAAITQGC